MYAALGIAALMAIGSGRHLIHVARVHRMFPAPGRLVDSGGYRVHIVAEGEQRSKPAIVWMAGGHVSGNFFHHLHRIFREEARSILIDRPGTGWSDVGPFPRTTAREAVEMFATLEKAGEPGPFLLVGLSFGGLLVANMARRRPGIVSGLILLDATPPDTIVYGPRHGILERMRRDAIRTAIQRLFGFHENLARTQLDDFDKGRVDNMIAQLGAAETVARAVDSRSGSSLASASIFEELSGTGMAAAGWEIAVYDGDLGDMPLFLVAPGNMSHAEFEQTWAFLAKEAEKHGDAEREKERARRFYLRTRERYLAASSKSERIYAPEGTTHFFPYEVPEFVADVVRRML